MKTTAPRLTMADIRRDIDRIDENLVTLLAERQRLVEQAIAVKNATASRPACRNGSNR